VVFRCVDICSNGISSLPLDQFTPELEQVTAEAAWMKSPEPDLYTTTRDAICCIIVSLLLRGNAYLYVTSWYADGYPRSWVVLSPDAVAVTADKYGMPVYTVDAMPIPRERIWHLKHQSRPGSLTGMGPLQAVGDNLYGLAKAQGYATDLVGKDLMPLAALVHPEEQSATQSAELREQWEASPGLIRVLSGGLDIKALGLTPEDAQLLERMDFDSRNIATAFGIPAPMLNLAMQGAGLHYSSSEMDLRALWQLTLNPIADNVEQALSTMLPGQQTIRFDESAMLAGAFSEQVAAAVQLVNAGIWTKNEARHRFNLPEIPGLDDKQAVPPALQAFNDLQAQQQQQPSLQVVNNG
jgi:HK97 family phage portal protein